MFRYHTSAQHRERELAEREDLQAAFSRSLASTQEDFEGRVAELEKHIRSCS